MRRLRITLPEAASELADFFADLGALEVSRDASGATASFADEQPAGLEDRVEAFLHLADRRGTQARVETARGEGPWLEGWRGAFSGTDVARFRIRPPWAEPPRDGVHVIIDPRGAFGSGLHPSTRLALELIDEVVDGKRTFLDVGTGSGVLSVAAARCGLRALGTELEPAAREACRRTAALNGVEIELLDVFPDEPLDLVAANIPAPALIELAEPLRRLAAGALVISGMRREQAAQVLAVMGDFSVRRDSPDGEWAAFLL